MPFGQRKKIIEKVKAKGKKGKSGGGPDIMAGMQVCLRSSPMYHPGAVGFAFTEGLPRVGQLMEAAWSLEDTCRFKIRTHFRWGQWRKDTSGPIQYKDVLSVYFRDFHYKDEMVVRMSCLYNGNPFSGKTASLYWDPTYPQVFIHETKKYLIVRSLKCCEI